VRFGLLPDIGPKTIYKLGGLLGSWFFRGFFFFLGLFLFCGAFEGERSEEFYKAPFLLDGVELPEHPDQEEGKQNHRDDQGEK